jgi:hypothetical protein
MILFIPLLGILFYLAICILAVVLFVIVWGAGGLLVGLTHLVALATGRKRRPKAPPRSPLSARQAPRASGRPATEARAASEIWPKWNESHRQYVDSEKSLWQEKLDAQPTDGTPSGSERGSAEKPR